MKKLLNLVLSALQFVLLAPVMVLFGVTPEKGTLLFKGRSGQSYPMAFYASDVALAPVNIDNQGIGASTGSPTERAVPEDGWLKDVAIHTGMTVALQLAVSRNGAPTGAVLQVAAQLDTSNARMPLSIYYAKGDLLSMTQLA